MKDVVLFSVLNVKLNLIILEKHASNLNNLKKPKNVDSAKMNSPGLIKQLLRPSKMYVKIKNVKI